MTGISFVVATGGKNDASINQIIDSIEALHIPQYEVIIVGGETSTVNRANTKHLSFDEAQVSVPWLTKKKNMGARAAQYEVVVIMHDYIVFHPDWYKEFEKFGTHWDICVHQTLLSNGVRGDGWRIDSHPLLPRWCMVPYDMEDFAAYMGIQGNYFVIKRAWYLADPLDERRLFNQQDDTEWSRRIVPKSHIRCNPKCIVQHNKAKPDDPNHAIDYQTMLNHQHIWDALRACKMENFKLIGE
jgi:hypothetical protein